jgi:hypothetical protein
MALASSLLQHACWYRWCATKTCRLALGLAFEQIDDQLTRSKLLGAAVVCADQLAASCRAMLCAGGRNYCTVHDRHCAHFSHDCDLHCTANCRYTMLLSSKAAATCDGVYEMQYPKITESVRTHIGVQYCAPYPSWPSQDTQVNGTGLANLLGQACPSSTAGEAAQCTGDADPCVDKAACPEDSAVTCVPKACASKTMVNQFVTSAEPCQPLFFSAITGLPVSSCGITNQRLARQARQAEKRLGTGAADTGSADTVGGDAGNSQQQQAPMRLGSVLGGGSRLGPLPVLSDAAAGTSSP